MPKISVIMGVYNSQSEKVLSRSIDSILNQTFADFEFIICNDCSTKDYIKPLLESYARKDSRIVLLNNEVNSGLAFSLNHCLSVAKGEYIARMDDDDISLPNRFEIESDFLDNNLEYSLVSCNLLLINDSKIWGKQMLKEKPAINDLMYGTIFVHPAIMIRRNVLSEVGNYTVSSITRRTEDYDLYFKLTEKGFKGVNLQKFLYLYYQSDITYKKQKFCYRVDEYKLKKKWFKILKLFPKGIIYMYKPLLSGILPNWYKKRKKIKKFSISDSERKDFEMYEKYI